jgi:hypothetical protein
VVADVRTKYNDQAVWGGVEELVENIQGCNRKDGSDEWSRPPSHQRLESYFIEMLSDQSRRKMDGYLKW